MIENNIGLDYKVVFSYSRLQMTSFIIPVNEETMKELITVLKKSLLRPSALFVPTCLSPFGLH